VSFDEEKILLPDFPRTKHLPWKPNASREDLIATEDEAKVIFRGKELKDRLSTWKETFFGYVYVEEKVDGANVGFTRVNGQPIIRNRSHILRKGYSKRTTAKMQFAPIWNWYYENEDKFEWLEELGPFSLYGEWLVARHSIYYDQLPSYFLAFDLYDRLERKFVDPAITRGYMEMVGFSMPPALATDPQSYEQLEQLTQQPSAFSSERREGVYLKVSDGQYITHRFKMVRPDFCQGEHWSDSALVKNKLRDS
jgi:ATP-dependent RNA circularization protein (DNA/RNA ligase family)